MIWEALRCLQSKMNWTMFAQTQWVWPICQGRPQLTAMCKWQRHKHQDKPPSLTNTRPPAQRFQLLHMKTWDFCFRKLPRWPTELQVHRFTLNHLLRVCSPQVSYCRRQRNMLVSYTPLILPSNKDRRRERERDRDGGRERRSERNERQMKSTCHSGTFSCFI